MVLTRKWVFPAAAGCTVYLFSHNIDITEPGSTLLPIRVSVLPIGCADENGEALGVPYEARPPTILEYDPLADPTEETSPDPRVDLPWRLLYLRVYAQQIDKLSRITCCPFASSLLGRERKSPLALPENTLQNRSALDLQPRLHPG